MKFFKIMTVAGILTCCLTLLNIYLVSRIEESPSHSRIRGMESHKSNCYDKHDCVQQLEEAKQAAKMLGYTKNARNTGNAVPAEKSSKKNHRSPNLLFIMADQLRYDALSATGNSILYTPNIDSIAKDGVNFELCYSQCPVCGPARTCLMTGRTTEHTNIGSNGNIFNANHTHIPCYDKILSSQGYATEYYGKWHSPLDQALNYGNFVTPVGGPKMIKKYGHHTMQSQYWEYLDKHNITKFSESSASLDRPEYKGTQDNCIDLRPYKTNPLDARHGLEPGDDADVRQPDYHGISTTPSQHTFTAFQARQCIEAMKRLAHQDRPFSLHLSFHSPHAPMTPSEPFASMYDPSDMETPASISDPMDNSPYKAANKRLEHPEYADPKMIKYMIANYYALVKEIDEWVGQILAKLDELELRENTMVIFTSDHGEMLGSHGMREKNIFYEESVRVPLMIRFPGEITPGTVVAGKPVSHIDLFATILDYLGAGKHDSDGESLRKFIGEDGEDYETFAVSEWNMKEKNTPNLMIRNKRWKFMCPCHANSKVMNVLYDLQNDPYEMNNLLGCNPDKKKYAPQGMVMKEQLVLWLEKVGSQCIDDVKKRQII
jgi:arylsulfatase A-like enzyme